MYPLALHLASVILTHVPISSVNSTTTLVEVTPSQVIDPTAQTLPAKAFSFFVPIYCKSTLKLGMTVIVGLGVVVGVDVAVGVMVGVWVLVGVYVLVFVGVATHTGSVLRT
jgi:UDP-3-O-[3-hydroxymyristoyl] glucosamine N-acyltransferase